MTPGTILTQARRDNSFNVKFAVVILAACVITLGVHYKYIYNSIAGPFELDAALANDPGQHQFVHTKGELTDTGVVEQTVTKHFHVVVTSRKETAQYVTAQLEGQPLLVKLPKDFAGDDVQGKLTPLTFELKSLLPATPAPYPWMLDASEGAYRVPSLPFGIAALLLLPSLFWLRSARRRAVSAERHPELVALAKLGPPLPLIAQIEADVASAGAAAHVGELWLTPSWLVKFNFLVLCAATDVIGVGQELATKKPVANKPLEFRIVIWRRGKTSPETSTAVETVARAIMKRVAECTPWAVVDDVAQFRSDWKTDRADAERVADARRAAHV